MTGAACGPLVCKSFEGEPMKANQPVNPDLVKLVTDRAHKLARWRLWIGVDPQLLLAEIALKASRAVDPEQVLIDEARKLSDRISETQKQVGEAAFYVAAFNAVMFPLIIALLPPPKSQEVARRNAVIAAERAEQERHAVKAAAKRAGEAVDRLMRDAARAEQAAAQKAADEARAERERALIRTNRDEQDARLWGWLRAKGVLGQPK
jgi:hypothetical protein